MDSIHQVEINATPEAIYAAVTEQDGLQGWWSEFSKADPSPGYVNEVSFYGGAVVFELRNAQLESGKQVVWQVVGGPPPWVNTEITFAITPGEALTTLDFRHRGLDLPEGPFGGINYSWGWYLSSLKAYLEKGEGMPHTGADMAG